MSKFDALVPLREENTKTLIGKIDKLPTFMDSLNTLTTEVLAENYNDIEETFATIAMTNDGFLESKTHKFQYTKYALGQAVSRIKPPEVVGMAGYLAACPPDLRSTNFNFWHNEFYADATEKSRGNNVLLRTRVGEFSTLVLRAMVSQSYIPLDDTVIMNKLSEVLPDGAKMRLARGDLHSRFDILWPNKQQDIFPGDPILVALRISNSETGAGSVRLDPMIYHVYSNGCIILPTHGVNVAIRHVGEAANRLATAYVNTMEAIEPFIEEFKRSYSDDIIKEFENMDQMWDALKEAFQFNDLQIDLVKDAYNTKPNGTRASVVSALIVAAQDFVISTGEDMQRAAGKLVKYGWKPIKKFANI